jgi:peptide deformylase
MGRALAAPQIGAPVRVVFVEITGKQRWTMINPEITDVGSQDFLVWDDCFSFPNLLVRVTRAYRASLDRAIGNDPFSFRSEWEKVHDAAERYGPPKPREVNA